MKYFIGALWRDINSDDHIVREQAETEWDKRTKLYKERYLKERTLFPDDFIDLFESNYGFHDFKIRKIAMHMEKWSNRSCDVELSDGETVICLVFQNISSFMVNCPSLYAGFYNELKWSYAELGHKGKKLTLSVLCDFENEFALEFKSLSFNVNTKA